MFSCFVSTSPASLSPPSEATEGLLVLDERLNTSSSPYDTIILTNNLTNARAEELAYIVEPPSLRKNFFSFAVTAVGVWLCKPLLSMI
jgi:hypothetical protein